MKKSIIRFSGVPGKVPSRAARGAEIVFPDKVILMATRFMRAKFFALNRAVLLLAFSVFLPLAAQQTENSTSVDDEIDAILEEDGDRTPAPSPVSSVVDRASMPNVFVAADMVGTWVDEGTEKEAEENQFLVRETEFGFSGYVDQFSEGTMLIALHNESGQWYADLHELYLEFNTLPYGLYAKVGRFFLDIGRLNTFHRHDWAFTYAPLVHEALIDDEGTFDTGGEVSWLVPYIPFYQEIKFGAFNGQTWGHTHSAGVRKPHPLYTARLKNFIPLGLRQGFQFGATYLRFPYNEDENNYWDMAGADLTYKYETGRKTWVVWTTEYWYRDEQYTEDTGLDSVAKQGLYSYLEYKFHQNWRIGSRFDFFQDDVASGKSDYEESLWMTFSPSEFSYFRLTGERYDPYAGVDEYRMHVQADFILGFHPAHKY